MAQIFKNPIDQSENLSGPNIDGDMLLFLGHNRLEDLVARAGDWDKKRAAIIEFVNNELPLVRKGPNKEGKISFNYQPEYKDKPLDPDMVQRFADHYLDHWKDSMRVKAKRVYNENGDGGFVYTPYDMPED